MMPAFEPASFDPDFAAPSDWAALYRSHGLQVVPSLAPKAGTSWKRPAIEWRPLVNELASDFTFERWYGPEGTYRVHTNMGLVTGRASGNVFVIDLDDYKSAEARLWWTGLLTLHNYGEEPETWQQVTGGGGRQLLFRAPDGWHAPTNRTPVGVDIRGQGGFAMLPPSRHESGREYLWRPGCAPYEIEVAAAPPWLLDAVERLVAEHGGDLARAETGHERTASPVGDFDAFGSRVDGREDYMTRVVWGAMVDWWRECPIPPPKAESEARCREAYDAYRRGVKSRLTGTHDEEALEREGRGFSLFTDKWRRAMAQWGGKVAEEGRKPVPKSVVGIPASEQYQTLSPGVGRALTAAPTIRTFDFATLVLEDVTEEADYIEKSLLGFGGFCLIGGPPKAQKSWLLQDVLVSCATGSPFLASTFTVPRPLRVFWLQAEMNEKLLRRRAKAVTGLSPQNLDDLASNLIVSDRFRMVLDPAGVETAAKLIRSQFPDEPPDVIAFDPMANLFDQENENDNAQVMKFLTLRVEAVRQLVNPLAGVILVHHATKKGPDEIRRDPFNCFRGGGALRGHYDSGLIIFRASEDGDAREIHFELRGGDTPDPMTVKLENGRMVKAQNRFFGSDGDKDWPDLTTCRLITAAIETAWRKGLPWSSYPQARRDGRYAPALLANDFGVKPQVAEAMIEKWLTTGVLAVDIINSNTKTKGLRVAIPL